MTLNELSCFHHQFCEESLFICCIHPVTGGGKNIIFWKGDTHFEAAKLAVKFTLVEVWHGMPAIPVEHRGLWIPLCHSHAVGDVTHPGEPGGGKLDKEG